MRTETGETVIYRFDKKIISTATGATYLTRNLQAAKSQGWPMANVD